MSYLQTVSSSAIKFSFFVYYLRILSQDIHFHNFDVSDVNSSSYLIDKIIQKFFKEKKGL